MQNTYWIIKDPEKSERQLNRKVLGTFGLVSNAFLTVSVRIFFEKME